MLRRLAAGVLLQLLCRTAAPVAAERRGYDVGAWGAVHPDFNWHGRRTGTTPYWYPALAAWEHYNASALAEAPWDPVPWTRGRMVRNWILLNASAFELWSLYEPGAVGKWPVAPAARPDGLREGHYVYVKTPHRVTRLPGVRLPASVVLPDGHDSSRVTVVQPDAAAYAGPRWLPSQREAETLRYLHAQGDDPHFYRRWCFSELWLSDTVHGCKEGRKLGLFCQYHGLTGELLQLIRMRERALLPTTSPEALAYYDPGSDCHLDGMEKELSRLDSRVERATLGSAAARALAAGEPIERVLELGEWTTFNARLVQSKGLLGPEIACAVEDRPADEFVYSSPYLNDPDAYLDLRWKDGMYARIPKQLAPEMDDISLEIGGFTAHGDFHRLMAVGSRSTGYLHTSVYERWSKRSTLDESGDEMGKRPMDLMDKMRETYR